MTTNLDKYKLPFTEEQAKERFEQFEDFDPFPDIPPALLNSADITEYVRVTGMVYPFEHDPDKGKLKSASYEIDFLGDVYIWREGAKDYTIEPIVPNKYFEIPKNSIVFVSTKTTFRLPDYIALRFNLRIKHVHRGLLLGTGPLVDPGFAGNLFIPLHNLTSEPYSIKGGEGLIWVEFTKISPHPHWAKRGNPAGSYVPFPKKARNLTALTYINKMSGNGKLPKSSIPDEVAEAKSRSEKAYQRLKQLSVGGTIALIFSMAAVILPVIALVQDSTTNFSGYIKDVAEAKKTIDLQASTISDLQKRLDSIERSLRSKSVNQAPKKSNCATSIKIDCKQDCSGDCSSK